MTTPTNHFVTLTIPDGKTIRGKVVYIQSKQERWRLQSAQVHIVCSEWLEPDWYPAVYSTGDMWFGGMYCPLTYELGTPHGWLFKGTFELTE